MKAHVATLVLDDGTRITAVIPEVPGIEHRRVVSLEVTEAREMAGCSLGPVDELFETVGSLARRHAGA